MTLELNDPPALSEPADRGFLHAGAVSVELAETDEQILATRHGTATKGDGPIGSSRADYAWAIAGALALALVGGGLSILHSKQTGAGAQTVADSAGAASPRPGTPVTRRPHPDDRRSVVVSLTDHALANAAAWTS